MGEGNRSAGRDFYEKVKGDVTVSNITGDHAQPVINAQKLAEGITPASPKEDVAQLLALIKEEIAKLKVDEEAKGEIVHEVEGAELQLKKAEPDKPKAAGALQRATESLKAFTTMVPEAVAVGNMLGQAIQWCGEQWIKWVR